MSEYKYPCGCAFPKQNNHIVFDPATMHNLNCQRTWELICDGNTKGCFQLESRLGRMMAKKLKPTNN